MALIYVACGFLLAAAEATDPRVTSLSDQATNIACWANDILSYPKESARSRAVHSLPVVLSTQLGIGEQESLDHVAAMHDREVERYVLCEASVREHASAQLHRYLDDLRFWMRGNLDWSLETQRYRSTGHGDRKSV